MSIEQEIKDWQDLNREREWYGYLNNFWCNMPGGRHRNRTKQVGGWDIFYKIWLKNWGPQDWERMLQEHSQIYLNQTGEEFFKTVDRTIKDHGISGRKIESLVKNIDKHFDDTKRAMDYMKELYDLVLPVYTDLRNMGYSKGELTS